MRRNEILALQWDHVDFAAGEIRVEQSVVHVRGETSRKAPKNGEARTIILPVDAVTELRSIKVEQARELLRLGVRQDGSTEVCRRGADGAMRSPYSLSDAFVSLVKKAGLPACNFHTLRHSHASELLRVGVPVHVASARLGHKDGGALLLRTYAHVTETAIATPLPELADCSPNCSNGVASLARTLVPHSVASYRTVRISARLGPVPSRPVLPVANASGSKL